MLRHLRSAAAARRTCCAVAAWISLVSFAAAQTTPPATSTAAAPPITLLPLDGDGDGKVTRAEWTKFMQTFTAMDTNKDSAIDLAELQKAAGSTAETPGILPAGDSDGNGKLTRPEWSNISLIRGFPRFDTNKDNNVTLPEMEAAVARAKEAAKPGAAAASSSGTWRGVLVQGRGDTPNEVQSQIELTIEGNRIVGREHPRQGNITPGGGRPLGSGTFVMTGGGAVGNLDAQYTDGPNAGQVCLGIFRMQGDVLQWCCSNRPSQRPTDFATGNGNWLMLLRKADATAQQ